MFLITWYNSTILLKPLEVWNCIAYSCGRSIDKPEMSLYDIWCIYIFEWPMVSFLFWFLASMKRGMMLIFVIMHHCCILRI